MRPGEGSTDEADRPGGPGGAAGPQATPGLRVHDDLLAALPAWCAARLLVAVAWVVDRVLVDRRLGGVEPVATRQGLFAWDASYYRDIAERGYLGLATDDIRFHPLLPLLGHNGLGILVLANLGGLAAAAAVHRLVLVEGGDADRARRAATLVGLAPPAFCLVWAYAEGPFIALAALQLLALRRRRWWWAGGLGVAAALLRPSGLLLVVPAAVEAWEARPRGEWVGRLAAIAGPVAGMAVFLVWAQLAVDDLWAPISVQSDLRGGFVLPPLRLVEGLGEVVGDPFGDGLHVPFAFGMVALLWVCWKRLPRSWTALAAVSVAVTLAADNLNSSERYAYATVPLLVALAVITGGRWWRPTVAVCSLGLVGMTTAAWYGRFVP